MERSTRVQLWRELGGKHISKAAELANTYDMPLSPSPQRAEEKGKRKTVPKTAQDRFVASLFGAELEQESPATSEKTAALHPTVNVTGKEAPRPVLVKKAGRYALPSQEMYPLDGYQDVKTAAAYFDEWSGSMDPSMRREYCKNLVKRAADLGIPVSDSAATYGSDCYGSSGQIKIALEMRRYVVDEQNQAVLDKLAAVQPGMLPESFASALGQFDRAAGITHLYGQHVPDPYVSTFSKAAADNGGEAIALDTEYLPMKTLVQFATVGNKMVAGRFGDDFAKEFAKDPKGIFNSLPRDQKLVVMRMAKNSAGGTETASTA